MKERSLDMLIGEGEKAGIRAGIRLMKISFLSSDCGEGIWGQARDVTKKAIAAGQGNQGGNHCSSRTSVLGSMFPTVSLFGSTGHSSRMILEFHASTT